MIYNDRLKLDIFIQVADTILLPGQQKKNYFLTSTISMHLLVDRHRYNKRAQSRQQSIISKKVNLKNVNVEGLEMRHLS